MEFAFQVHGCPPGDWTEQLALALEQRTQAYSRQRLPGLWRTIDKLGTPKMPEPVLKRRRVRYKIYGVILVLLGLFLLIPGLMEPETLQVPLLAGLFATGTGILQLLPRKRYPSKTMLKQADQLLEQRRTIPDTTVHFTEHGIADDGAPIDFSQIEVIVEAPDLFLIAWADKGLVLWKQELAAGAPEDFSKWLAEHHPVIHM